MRFFQTMQLSDFNHSIIDNIYDHLLFKPLKRDVAHNKRHFEINPPLKGNIAKALEIFPNALFVHIVRDPRTLVVSGINWTQDKTFNTLFKLFFPFWRLRPHEYKLGSKKTDKLFEIAVLNWVVTNTEYAKLKNMTHRYHVLKFEDLENNPVEFIEAILNIAGFGRNHTKQIGAIAKSAFKNPSAKNYDTWQHWEGKYILYLHNKCGDLMQSYGYGLKKQWINKIHRHRG